MICQCCFSYPAHARGLCNRCYHGLEKQGELHLYPRLLRRRQDVVDDLLHLGFNPQRAHAPQFRKMAPRLNMTAHAVETAYRRWRNPYART